MLAHPSPSAQSFWCLGESRGGWEETDAGGRSFHGPHGPTGPARGCFWGSCARFGWPRASLAPLKRRLPTRCAEASPATSCHLRVTEHRTTRGPPGSCVQNLMVLSRHAARLVCSPQERTQIVAFGSLCADALLVRHQPSPAKLRDGQENSSNRLQTPRQLCEDDAGIWVGALGVRR